MGRRNMTISFYSGYKLPADYCPVGLPLSKLKCPFRRQMIIAPSHRSSRGITGAPNTLMAYKGFVMIRSAPADAVLLSDNPVEFLLSI